MEVYIAVVEPPVAWVLVLQHGHGSSGSGFDAIFSQAEHHHLVDFLVGLVNVLHQSRTVVDDSSGFPFGIGRFPNDVGQNLDTLFECDCKRKGIPSQWGKERNLMVVFLLCLFS